MEEQESIFSDIEALKLTEASRMQQFIANITDTVIQLLTIILLFTLLPKEILHAVLSVSKFMIYMLFFVWLWLYRSLCILLMGKTIGMSIVKINYLNKNLKPLTTAKEKFFAILAPSLNGIKAYKK